jgi:hypothetical protein
MFSKIVRKRKIPSNTTKISLHPKTNGCQISALISLRTTRIQYVIPNTTFWVDRTTNL